MKRKHNCNACQRKCDGDVVRDDRGNFIAFVPCPGFQPLRPMRVSLLEKSSEHEGWQVAVSEILHRAKIRLNDTVKCPFFRLYLTKVVAPTNAQLKRMNAYH